MKRKIAILLAATMTLSAVPTFAAKVVTSDKPEAGLTAVASQGKVLYDTTGTTFLSKAPADINMTSELEDSTKVEAYKKELQKREGVLKLDLSSALVNDFSKDTEIIIKLENGVFPSRLFGKQDPEELVYRNAYFQTQIGNSGSPSNNASTDGYKTESKAVNLYVKEGKLFKNVGGSSSNGEKDLSSSRTTDFTNLLFEIQPDIGVSQAWAKTQDTTPSKSITAALPHIPYTITVQDETTAVVKLLTDIKTVELERGKNSLPRWYKEGGDSDNTKEIKKDGTVAGYLAIPLGNVVEANGEEVKATVSGYSDAVEGKTVVLGKAVSNGSTMLDTSLISKKSFDGELVAGDILIKETVAGSINKDDVITLKVNSGFEFDTTGGADALDVKNPLNKNEDLVTDPDNDIKIEKDKITITLSKDDGFNKNSDKDAVKITLPKIKPANEDKSFGDVVLSISGTGKDFTSQEVTIGTREKYGVKLETKTEVPTIVKGRYYDVKSANQSSNGLNKKGNLSAEFELSEAVANSLLSQRALDFKVADGVKIVDAEIKSGPTTTGYTITNNGTTLRLKANQLGTSTSPRKIRMQLLLSVDSAFGGMEDKDIELTVSGGGITDEASVVIAKAMAPFEIDAPSTDINIGYQNYKAKDIVIKEKEAGMFMENGILTLSLDGAYGTRDIGFSRADVEASGNLEIKPATGNSYLTRKNNGDANIIEILVKNKSTKEPSTITIKNVEIGTTRSVPFGLYDLKIGGTAIINNDVTGNDGKALDTVDKGYNPNFTVANPSTQEDKLARIDASTGSFTKAGYVNVVTANNTIDKEVKVSIGSTNATIDGQEVAMDVAPYIQGAGNTMVPLRFVAVALAGGNSSSVEEAQNSDKVSWDPASKTVTIFYGAGINQKIIQFKIGSSNMIVDGNVIPMEHGAKAEIKNDRTFVPFRALGQALGVSVEWDQETKTATYNKQ